MLKLVVTIDTQDQHKNYTYEGDDAIILIGRESKNTLQIPMTTVSRQHCKISLLSQQYFLEDLNSSHGTYLNEQKIEPGEKKLLRDQDKIKISKATIFVSIEQTDLLKMNVPADASTEIITQKALQEMIEKIGKQEGQEDLPRLVITSGPDEGKTFYFKGALVNCIIGRSRESDLVVNDNNASRRHANIKKDSNGIYFQCLGPKNPTIINGQTVNKNAYRLLKDRDEIVIGHVKIVFIDPHAEILDKLLKDIPGFEPPKDKEPAVETPSDSEEEESSVSNSLEQSSESKEQDAAPETKEEQASAVSLEEQAKEEPQQNKNENQEQAAVELPDPKQDPAIKKIQTKTNTLKSKEIVIIMVLGAILLIGIVVLLLLI